MNIISFLYSLAMLRMAMLVCAGALLGWIYFCTLRWNTRLFLHGVGLWQPVAVLLARTSLTALALYFCARNGLSLPLILLGFLMARYLVLRKEKDT